MSERRSPITQDCEANISLQTAQILNLLDYCGRNGIQLDVSKPETIQDAIEQMEKKKYLAMHRWRIFESKGRWFTSAPEVIGGQLTGRAGKKISALTKRELEKQLVDIYKELIDNPTVEELFQDAVDENLEYGYIEITTHHRYGVLFRRHFSEIGKRRIRGVTEDDIVEFLRRRFVDEKLNAKGYGNLRTIVRLVFRRARDKKYIDYNVEDAITRAKPPKGAFRRNVADKREAQAEKGITPQKQVFTTEEMKKLIDYWTANPVPQNLGLLLMFSTGIRVGELCSLRWEDYDGRCLNIYKTEQVYPDPETGKRVCTVVYKPKTDAGERFPAVPTSVRWIFDKLKEYPTGEWMFMAKDRHRYNKFSRITEKTFCRWMKKSCEEAGIEYRSSHKLRKTYASALLDAGVDEKYITDTMGHVSIQTTRDFYGFDRRSGEEKVSVIDAIPEFQSIPSAM